VAMKMPVKFYVSGFYAANSLSKTIAKIILWCKTAKNTS
jgi:hypothetical protein